MKWIGIAIMVVILTMSTASGGIPPVPDGPGFLPGDSDVEVAPYVQETPAVAAGGSGFLAVWTDLRTDDSFFGYEQGARDIYAARLDVAGNLIDTSPIVVNQAFGAQEQPQVSWNGENWLVVWENQTMGVSYYESRIFAVRVAPDGMVLDDPPIQVVADGSSGLYLAVTSRGTEWLVVGQGFDAGDPGIVGVRLSGAGVVLDPDPVVLVPDTYFLYFNISVHSAQGEYLLTYEASSEFKAQRFQSDLVPIGASFNVPGLTVGSNGTNHFIVWTSGGTLVGSTMSPDGTLQSPAGVAITSSDFWEVNVTWDGVNWWVSKLDGWDGIVLARVTTGDVVLDPGGFAYDPALVDFVSQHRIAGGLAGGVQLVWKDDRAGGLAPYDIHGAFVAADAQPTPDGSIARSAHAQSRPDLAVGPDGFLAVFDDSWSGGTRILAQRLDNLGQAIDAEPLEVTAGPNAVSPAAAWNGSVYLVVWYDYTTQTIFGRRLLPDGNFLDSQPLEIMSGITPDVSALGDVFLVAGTDINPGSPHFRFPFAVRVDGSTGNTLDAVPIWLGQYFAQVPAVTTFMGRWLVSWQRNPSHDDPQATLYAAFVEPDGSTPGEFVAAYNAFTPDIAVSGPVAMFVFRKNSTANANNDVAARRMIADGTFPAPEFVLSAATDRQRSPTVAWDGAQFVAAWEDLRDSEAFFDERTNIYAARISESGVLLDPSSFEIATHAIPERQPVLASAGGETLLAASIFRDAAPFNAYRVGVYHMEGTVTEPPEADFHGTPTAGCLPLAVDFVDDSIGGVTSWNWNFGDGGSSSLQSPSYMYETPGIYSVSLTVGGSMGSDGTARFDYITAAAPALAGFDASPTVVCAPLEEVAFTDLSDGFPDSWIWDFGDGSYSTEQHPRHTYQWPGTYSVSLTVSGSCGSDTTTVVDQIQVDPPCGYRALALSDIGVASSLAGDYTRTHVQDNLWEVMYEVVVDDGAGAYSKLDHRWDFDVAAGVSVTFNVETYRNSPWESEGFRLEYSTDNANFQFLADVPVGEASFSIPLPANLSGTVYVRVVDTNHTPGNAAQDSVFIDYMDIESEVVLPPLPCGAVSGLVFVDREEMGWFPAEGATHYDVMRGDLDALGLNASVGDAQCSEAAMTGTTWSDTDVPPAGTGYYYILRGEASGRAPGTFDNPGPPPIGFEGRDAEIGTAGASPCGIM